VTNVSNGKSVVVSVTDRGPFHADRVIDLSYLAAYRLGYVDNGSTLVEVESILPEGATTMSYAQVMPAPAPARVVPGPASATRLSCWRPSSASTRRPRIPAGRCAAAAHFHRPPRRLWAYAAFSCNWVPLPAPKTPRVCVPICLRELDWLNEGIQINAGGGMHRVHLGPYISRAMPKRSPRGFVWPWVTSPPSWRADQASSLSSGRNTPCTTFLPCPSCTTWLLISTGMQLAVVSEHFAAHRLRTAAPGQLLAQITNVQAVAAGMDCIALDAEKRLQLSSEEFFSPGVGFENMPGVGVGDQDGVTRTLEQARRRLLASRSSSLIESS
jgi:hypothetical protein